MGEYTDRFLRNILQGIFLYYLLGLIPCWYFLVLDILVCSHCRYLWQSIDRNRDYGFKSAAAGQCEADICVELNPDSLLNSAKETGEQGVRSRRKVLLHFSSVFPGSVHKSVAKRWLILKLFSFQMGHPGYFCGSPPTKYFMNLFFL